MKKLLLAFLISIPMPAMAARIQASGAPGSSSGSAGGGTTIEVEDDGVSRVNTSTINFGVGLSASDSSGEALVSLAADASFYIQVRDTLQSGATFYVSSGSVAGPFRLYPLVPDNNYSFLFDMKKSAIAPDVFTHLHKDGQGFQLVSSSGFLNSVISFNPSYLSFFVKGNTMAEMNASGTFFYTTPGGTDDYIQMGNNSGAPVLAMKVDGLTDTAQWSVTDADGVTRFRFDGLGTSGGFDFAASTFQTGAPLSRIRLSDQNDNWLIRFNTAGNGFRLEQSSMSFDSGSDDPVLNWGLDGALAVLNGTFTVTENLKLPYLANQPCIGTNASANVVAGVCSGGSGGASTLAVTTGNVTGFTVTTSSPTAIINFSSSTFKVQLTGSATAFVTLDASSVTLLGNSINVGEISATGTPSATTALFGDGTWKLTSSSSPSPTPSINAYDSDATDGDINGQIQWNCPDAGSGTEDCDMYINQQINGTFTRAMTFDADSNITSSRTFVISGGNEIRLEDSDSSHYASFKSSPAMTTNIGFILPQSTTAATVGGNLEIASINGTAVTLEFGTDGGGGGSDVQSVGTTFDGGGTVILAFSTSAAITVPYDCTISSWTIVQATGTIAIDVRRASFASYNGPDSALSIVGAGTKPFVTNGVKNGAAPASWTSTTITAYDVIHFVPTSVSGTIYSTIILTLTKT